MDHLQDRLNDYGKELTSYKNELEKLADSKEIDNKTKMKLLRDQVKDLKARVQKSGLEGRQKLLADIAILLDCQKRIMAGNQPDLMSKVTSAFSRRDKPVVAAKPTSYTAGIGEGASGTSQAQGGFAAAPHRGRPGTPYGIPLEKAVFAALKIASRLKYVSLKIDFYYKGSASEEDVVRQHAAAFS